MFGNKKKYDLIFSIGAECSCTQALRSAGLQISSYPLDWVYGSDFTGRITLVANNFKRFIDKSDLEFAFSASTISCDVYHNKYNNIKFNHDFPMHVPLDISYDKVKEKYDRRCTRLLHQIERAKKILMVYITTPNATTSIPDSVLKKGHETIKNCHPNKIIELLYIVPDANMLDTQSKIEHLSRNIIKITSNYKNVNTGAMAYEVNEKVLITLLKKYQLTTPFLKKLLKGINTIWISCIPIRSIRKKMRRKYHF